MSKMVRIGADVEEQTRAALFVKLRAKGLTFSAWLRKKVAEYVGHEGGDIKKGTRKAKSKKGPAPGA